jgi:hypothetical protein
MGIQREPGEPALRYIHLLVRRRQEIAEEAIAEQLGFGSSLALYARLEAEGYPICKVCGATDVPKEHCEPPKQSRQRRALQGEGEATELPAAGGAVPLLKEVLKELVEAVDQLGERTEYLKDERFVARYQHEGPQPQDQRITFFGASQHPPEPLTKLIAVYALSDEPLEHLVVALHPAPSETDARRVEQAVEELKDKAAQLAKLVRGRRSLRRGPSTGEASSREQIIAWMVRDHHERGLSENEIQESLKRDGFPITIAELRRLKNLELP